MINSQIAKRIRNYLFHNRELKLPGIGVFRVHHIDQYLNDNDTIIHPPFLKVRFQREGLNTSKNQTLKILHTDNELKETLENYFDEVINDVLNFGEGVIDGLGSLHQNKRGEICFTPYDMLDIENRYLPIVDTLPFVQKNKTTQLDIPPKSARDGVLMPPKKENDEPLIIEIKRESSLKKKSLVNSLERKIELPKAEPISHVSNENRYPLYALTGLAVLLGCAFVIKTCFYSSSNILDPIEVGIIDYQEENSMPNGLGLASTLANNCIIILGSFRSDQSAYNLESKLRKDGYDTVVHAFNGYKRVGIEFLCDSDADLPAHLTDIRNQYKVDAWFLEPAVEVL